MRPVRKEVDLNTSWKLGAVFERKLLEDVARKPSAWINPQNFLDLYNIMVAMRKSYSAKNNTPKYIAFVEFLRKTLRNPLFSTYASI